MRRRTPPVTGAADGRRRSGHLPANTHRLRRGDSTGHYLWRGTCDNRVFHRSCGQHVDGAACRVDSTAWRWGQDCEANPQELIILPLTRHDADPRLWGKISSWEIPDRGCTPQITFDPRLTRVL